MPSQFACLYSFISYLYLIVLFIHHLLVICLSVYLIIVCFLIHNSVVVEFECCILTFDPAKHAIPKMAEVHIPLVWASLADKMGQVTIPWYTHRLIHRKRVTSELHDSNFRLMMIKHASPKTPEVAYSGLASHESRY